MAGVSTASSPMNGGDGLYSYNRNSSLQRDGVETARVLIRKAISEKLDVKEVISSSTSSSKLFCIADLGCSVGPNTFIAVQNIIESVLLKYQSYEPNQEPLEFQVFFNDHTANDFNMLFKSLPSDKQYFATGVPGPFHGRLFPKASLHFVHSSYALHWLSSAPKEVADKNSLAYNKGRIYYENHSSAVGEAYSAQFVKDMESFLNARAQEIVSGGLMAFIIPCLKDGFQLSQSSYFTFINVLEACILDLVKMGLVSEDKVDSFNMPRYSTTPLELKSLIERNACFSIERMEPLERSTKRAMVYNIQTLVMHLRAVWEGLIKQHFGSEITDEIFDRFSKKVEGLPIFSSLSSDQSVIELFVLVKRITA